MRINRNFSLGNEDAPEIEISVQTDTDNEDCILLFVTDHIGQEDVDEPTTACAVFSREEAIAFAQLLKDAANDG